MRLRIAGLLALTWALAGCSVVGYPSPFPPAGAAPVPASLPATPIAGAELDGSQPPERPAMSAADFQIDDAPAEIAGSYVVLGERYEILASAVGYREGGVASFYADAFEGARTASGESYDPRAMTAAHRTLPLGTWVEVTNLENGRTILVRINDRGPFRETDTRVIDLSGAAARALGMTGAGLAPVEVRAVSPPTEASRGGP